MKLVRQPYSRVNCYHSRFKNCPLSISCQHAVLEDFVCTENCKLVVRLQMQNTLGIVVIGQLDG